MASAAGLTLENITVSDREWDYGSRDVGLLDPEGHAWHFGTYAGEE